MRPLLPPIPCPRSSGRPLRRIPLAVAIVILISGQLIEAETIDVRHNAEGADRGTSWADAHTALQQAPTVAAVGDDIWGAAGTGNPLDGDADGMPGGDVSVELVLTDPASAAFGFIREEMDRYHRTFDVYTDADAGGNHFYPSGYQNGSDTLAVNTRWPDGVYSGTSCIRVDWSGGSGADGWAWNGLLFEEPEGFLGTLAGNGYDLTGATALSFYARSDEPGLGVQFGFGHPTADSSGVHKQWIELSTDWRRYEIDLTGLDLSSIHGGFLFVLNDVHDPAPVGATFYLDDIRYNLTRLEDLRLIRSHVAATDTEDFDIHNRNVATVYDNALAILALLHRGAADDIVRARKIGDALVFLHNNDVDMVPSDWAYHPVPFTGRRLRDAYSSGDLMDAQGNVRYAGYWDEQEGQWMMHESALSFRTGDLAWGMLALARLGRAVSGGDCLAAALGMGNWIETNCRRNGEGPDAGYTGGWQWEWDTEAWLELGVSTEHNIDLTAAFVTLHNETGDPAWLERADHARAFVQSMWLAEQGRFATGLDADGTTSSVGALDPQAWGAMLLDADPYADALDWAVANLRVPVATGTSLRFDFNTDLDGTWYEGTAQMAAAFRHAGRLQDESDALATLREAQLHESFADGRGIPAADIPNLTTGFDWTYSNRLALGATAWFILAEQGVNPFRDTVRLRYAAGSGGTLDGVTSQTVEHGSDATAVTAVPAAGYRFVQWSDGSTENPRIDTDVTADISVTSQFEPKPHDADQNGDWKIQVSPELTRLIQFYNSGGYCVQEGTEDGFAPGAGDGSGTPHSADQNGDWVIQISPELTRLIQFYNSGGYHLETGTEDGYAPGADDALPEIPEDFVSIPGGTFQMGDHLGDGFRHELPLHSVTVSPFLMMRTEGTNDEMVRVLQWAYDNGKLSVTSSTVTNAQGEQQELLDLDSSYCRITWDGSTFGMRSAKGAGYPCVEVTWYGAAAYCNYRSEMEGMTPCYELSDWSCNWEADGYRLPTEAEWEYAARGGLTGRRFPWGNEIPHSAANYHSSSAYSYDISETRGYHPDYHGGGYPYTSPVTAFAANDYGLHDMAGNILEWCWDWYDSDYYGESGGTTDPRGPGSGSSRILRGGGWGNTAIGCRVSFRNIASPGNGSDALGFRPVRSSP